jgi:hypothetical protein
MRMLCNFTLLALTALSMQAALPVPYTGVDTNGGPGVSFNGSSIAVSGATKGDVLYGAGLEIRGGEYAVRLEPRVATATVANDGTASLDMQARITVRSIWIVVDGKGGYTVTPGPGMVRRLLALDGNAQVSSSDGQVRQLLVNRYSVYVYLVRPGVGMWGSRLMDHPQDGDPHANGSVIGALQSLVPEAGTIADPPDHMSAGDVLFIVDPYTLEYAVSRKGN